VTALWEKDAITLAGMLRSREVSAREVIAAHIERIEAVDPAVNAVVTRCFEQAMAKAAAADQAGAAVRDRVRLAAARPPRRRRPERDLERRARAGTDRG
jgi:Asp-tRNA(Asn)/Glu-tRNA(Gln) amidotransferase A subunit family amidase